NPALAALRPESPSNSEDGSNIPFNRMEFRSNNEGKIIFDKDALAFINRLLPRIHIPTWIQRALPILGKASFGSLKADKWRNLFTVQLPLILPVYWATGRPVARSLFRNFAHLVSMVKLALKRSINLETVEMYRKHTLEYLQSCRLLFPNVNLAPNHHMSIHLTEGMENMGPSRSKLKITFLTNFCRLANLQAVLSAPERFPADLQPYLRQLKSLFEESLCEDKIIPKSRQGFLDSSALKVLIRRLNKLFPCPTGATWITSNAWDKKREAESAKFLSVTSRIENLSTCEINKVNFSTYRENPSNSVIVLRANCAPQYGIIEQIFRHTRILGNGTSAANTWLAVQPLLPCNFPNPFAGQPDFELNVELRTFQTNTDTLYVNHPTEVLAHCSFIKYKPSEILPSIKKECIAVVSLER
ncbi:hypothetical protein PCANC_28642, partial [Puccinia coronata f. sp. avenae]